MIMRACARLLARSFACDITSIHCNLFVYSSYIFTMKHEILHDLCLRCAESARISECRNQKMNTAGW